jgi:hypothetical protein
LESEKTITPVSGNANQLALDTVTTPSPATTARSGFPNRRYSGEFKFPARDIEDLGKDGTFKSPSGQPLFNFKTTLAHEPMGRIKIRIHPSVEGRNSILDDPGPYTEEQLAANEVYIGRIFKSAYGLHMFDWIDTQGVGSIGHLYVKVNGKEINFASPFSLGDHPGNIDSGGNTDDMPSGFLNELRRGDGIPVTGGSLGGPEVFKVHPNLRKPESYGTGSWKNTGYKSDDGLNAYLKGAAVHISYDYLDNYDADVAT